MNQDEKARLWRIGKYECVFAAIIVLGMLGALYITATQFDETELKTVATIAPVIAALGAGRAIGAAKGWLS